MKILVCLLMGGAAFLGTFATLYALHPDAVGALGPEGTTDAGRDPAWDPVYRLAADMRSMARDTCQLDPTAPSTETYDTIELRYRSVAGDYRNRVQELVLSGVERPRDLTASPLSLAEMRSVVCKTPTPTPTPIPTPTPTFNLNDRFFTLEALDAAGRLAGWPQEPGWWPEMRRIIQCETRSLDRMAHNTGDPNGGSYGLAQLNGRQHFDKAGEDFEMRFDAVVNLRTALWLRTVRGHFGGFGGWGVCAAGLGIR